MMTITVIFAPHGQIARKDHLQRQRKADHMQSKTLIINKLRIFLQPLKFNKRKLTFAAHNGKKTK